jgi:hypothetical protein
VIELTTSGRLRRGLHVAHEAAVDLDEVDVQRAQCPNEQKPVPKSSSANGTEAAQLVDDALHRAGRASRWFSVISKHRRSACTSLRCRRSATKPTKPSSISAPPTG